MPVGDSSVRLGHLMPVGDSHTVWNVCLCRWVPVCVCVSVHLCLCLRLFVLGLGLGLCGFFERWSNVGRTCRRLGRWAYLTRWVLFITSIYYWACFQSEYMHDTQYRANLCVVYYTCPSGGQWDTRGGECPTVMALILFRWLSERWSCFIHRALECLGCLSKNT